MPAPADVPTTRARPTHIHVLWQGEPGRMHVLRYYADAAFALATLPGAWTSVPTADATLPVWTRPVLARGARGEHFRLETRVLNPPLARALTPLVGARPGGETVSGDHFSANQDVHALMLDGRTQDVLLGVYTDPALAAAERPGPWSYVDGGYAWTQTLPGGRELQIHTVQIHAARERA